MNKIAINRPAVILKPTNHLRIDMSRNIGQGGELQQLWVDDYSGKKIWKPVSMVYCN